MMNLYFKNMKQLKVLQIKEGTRWYDVKIDDKVIMSTGYSEDIKEKFRNQINKYDQELRVVSVYYPLLEASVITLNNDDLTYRVTTDLTKLDAEDVNKLSYLFEVSTETKENQWGDNGLVHTLLHRINFTDDEFITLNI